MTEYAGSRRQFLELAAQYDAPAFAQRAQTVHEAEGQLWGVCERERTALLKMPALRLARLAALIELRWERIAPFFTDASHVNYLAEYRTAWQPSLRASVPATESTQQIRRAIQDLTDSFRRFNRHWQRMLDALDLGEVNTARRKYNAYYVIEKSAALQSESLAARGFQELPLLTRADIEQRYPYLLVPELRSR